MFFTWDDVIRIYREVASLPRDFVSDEFRGWNWGKPPVLHTSSVQLPVSDIVSTFCSTRRYVYVKYVLKVKPRVSEFVQKGLLVHRVFAEAITCVKRLLYMHDVESGFELIELMKSEGKKVLAKVLESEDWTLPREFIENAFWNIWSQASTIYAGALDKIKRGSNMSLQYRDSTTLHVVPIVTECMLDGSLVGVRQARLDAILWPNMPVEIKVTQSEEECMLALAGYAMVMESQFAQPVDFGLVVNVHVDSEGNVSWRWRVVQIGDDVRSKFLHERDVRCDIVEKEVDPGLPEQCPKWCPYYHYCVEEDSTGETTRRVLRKVRVKAR